MNRLIGKYSAFLVLGIIIVLVSFGVGAYRTTNQATLSQLEFEGDTTSSAYRTALTTEEILKRFSEIVPLLGLGFLKLGIGFAIATIILNLRATGENARASLKKAGQEIAEIRPPFFARNFSRFLVLGIIIELVAAGVMVGWMITGLRLIDLEFADQTSSEAFLQTTIFDKTFAALAEPIEGLGVAFLIGGIAFGLATIVANLGMQATILPKKLTALASGKVKSEMPRLTQLIPKKVLGTTVLGMIITASGLIPIAVIRAVNVSTLESLIFDGDTSSATYQNTKVMETIIGFTWETWIFVGIAIMLFSIGFWLLTIIKQLRAQRSNLGNAVSEITGQRVPSIEPPLGITKSVPLFLVAGLLWMLIFFWGFTIVRDISGLTVLTEEFAGRVGSELFKQNTITQTILGELVRPGKAIGLALLFTGIGLTLLTIVINLRLTALMLPGSFTKIVNAIKGEATSKDAQAEESTVNPMSLAPRRLFLGILVGVMIVVIGTFPLALIRINYTEIFLTEKLAGITNSNAFQTGLQTQLMLEHFIGPWVAVGTGLIFFFIGRFFSAIVGFVKGRRQLISEGVESAVYYALETKKSKKKESSSS